MDLTKERYFSICLNFLKALQFAVLIPCTIFKFDPSGSLIDCLALNLSSSLFGMAFSFISMFYIFRSVTVFLNVADQLKHTIPEERTTNLTDVQFCFSETVYVADSNIRMGEIDEPTMKLYDNIAKSSITVTLKTRYSWYRNGDNLYSLVNFTSMIYSIITLSTTSMNGVTEANLIIYVVIVGLSEITMILGCLLVALAPLICVGLCIFCCFCKKNPAESGSFINIPMKDATLNDIVNAGGNCSICYQSINEKEKIYVLLCSDKHVFHCECLRHWTKVKNNCPICRQEIPMIDHSLEGEGLANEDSPQ